MKDDPNGREKRNYRRRFRHGRRHGFGHISSIAELKPGQKGTITCIRGDRRVVQRLADLGFTRKASIDILKSAPFNGPVEVCLRGSKLAVGREIAENILVRVEET